MILAALTAEPCSPKSLATWIALSLAFFICLFFTSGLVQLEYNCFRLFCTDAVIFTLLLLILRLCNVHPDSNSFFSVSLNFVTFTDRGVEPVPL